MMPFARQLERLQTIPGIGIVTAQVFIAETGDDMTRFGSPEQLAAWLGVRPQCTSPPASARPAGSRRGNKWLCSVLVEAANSVSRTKNTYLASQFKRIASRRGHGRAAVVVTHSILVSAYWMLVRDEPYQDFGPHWLSERPLAACSWYPDRAQARWDRWRSNQETRDLLPPAFRGVLQCLAQFADPVVAGDAIGDRHARSGPRLPAPPGPLRRLDGLAEPGVETPDSTRITSKSPKGLSGARRSSSTIAAARAPHRDGP